MATQTSLIQCDHGFAAHSLSKPDYIILDKPNEETSHSLPPAVQLKPGDVCSNPTLLWSRCRDCGQVYCVSQPCKKRSCVYCQKERAKTLFIKYMPIVEQWNPDHPKLRIQFLTLTIKNVPDCTREWIDRQDKYLRNFIQRLKRKGYVTDYGMICKEMTHHPVGSPKLNKRGRRIGVYTEKDAGYHYHYHILFYGPWINLKDPAFNLSSIWRSITKTSFIVNLRPHRRSGGKLFFKSAGGALSYMMKYVCKPQDDTEAMALYFKVTKGKRYFQTFGRKYGKAEQPVSDKLKLRCYKCGGMLGRGYNVFSENAPSDWDYSNIQVYSYSALRRYYKFKDASDDALLSRAELMLRKVSDRVWNEPRNGAKISEVFTERDLFFLRDSGYIFQSRHDEWRLF